MKIHAIRGENMMRMKVFDISFDDKGNTIIISGKNGEGKSSFINSLVLGLGGNKTDVAKLTSQPIRTGAKKAWVEVDVGEWTVRRSWSNNDTSSLTIVGKDGSKFPSPQKMLDKILGDLSFDPLAFTRMTPKEQRALLLSIVDIPLDLAAHDAERDTIYQQRTAIGREVDRLKGAVESAPDVPEDTPAEELDIVDLVRMRDAARENYDDASATANLCDDLRRQIAQLEIKLTELTAQLKHEEKVLAGYGDLSNLLSAVEKLTLRLNQADSVNKAVRAKHERAKMIEHYENEHAKYTQYTTRLNELDDIKRAALEKAEMPIDGLSFDEDGVTFNGIPFAQLSTSQQIKVSTAIGMAQQPELRLMIVKDGALLDSNNLQALNKMAEANDYQVLVEMVDESREMGIVIEDGEVVSDSPSSNG